MSSIISVSASRGRVRGRPIYRLPVSIRICCLLSGPDVYHLLELEMIRGHPTFHENKTVMSGTPPELMLLRTRGRLCLSDPKTSSNRSNQSCSSFLPLSFVEYLQSISENRHGCSGLTISCPGMAETAFTPLGFALLIALPSCLLQPLIHITSAPGEMYDRCIAGWGPLVSLNDQDSLVDSCNNSLPVARLGTVRRPDKSYSYAFRIHACWVVLSIFATGHWPRLLSFVWG